MGSYMAISTKSFVACGCLVAVLAAASACSPKRVPPMSVSELLEERVTLDGVLMECNQNPSKARSDVECQTARIAIERRGRQNEAAAEAKRAEEFERSREQLRMAQEKQRQEQAAKVKPVDVYHLPLVPMEPPPPAPAPAAPATTAQPPSDAGAPPVVRQSNP